MKLIVIIFISVSLLIDFFASLISTREEESTVSAVNCIWSALIIFAWAYILRGYVL
jgi:hypothetical protein